MALFKINGSNVQKIQIKQLDLEKHLQDLFEKNLEEILNITFLAHEYSTSFGGRIDTLGIDNDGSPCIIEYKKNQNDNVINQGLSYLRWLLDHKSDFELLCQNLQIKKEIDWNSPRVICVAESYNKFDINTVDILPLKIELLKYRLYNDNILYLEPENYQKVKISTSKIIKNNKEIIQRSAPLQKEFSLEEHLLKANNDVKDLFSVLREKIFELDDAIIEEAKAKYIAYKMSTNFLDVVIQSEGLKIFLNVKTGQLKDPKNFARDLVNPRPIGHWGNGDYEIKVENNDNLDYIFELIKQSYDLNK